MLARSDVAKCLFSKGHAITPPGADRRFLPTLARTSLPTLPFGLPTLASPPLRDRDASGQLGAQARGQHFAGELHLEQVEDGALRDGAEAVFGGGIAGGALRDGGVERGLGALGGALRGGGEVGLAEAAVGPGGELAGPGA